MAYPAPARTEADCLRRKRWEEPDMYSDREGKRICTYSGGFYARENVAKYLRVFGVRVSISQWGISIRCGASGELVGSANLSRSAKTPSNTIQPRRVLMAAAAYDAFAPYYKAYSKTKEPYLRRIEDIIIARANGAASLMDAGAGDGSRALRITLAASVKRTVLLEPSAGMRAQCAEGSEIWPCEVSEIPDGMERFEIITCLWNVLGHVQGTQQKLFFLAKLKTLLSPGGMIFLDVSHRYNAAAYGWIKTIARMAHDLVLPSENHGDVIVSWKAGRRTISTQGHVFTHGELQWLFRSAALKIVERWVIDYENGAERKVSLTGHLLYQLTAA